MHALYRNDRSNTLNATGSGGSMTPTRRSHVVHGVGSMVRIHATCVNRMYVVVKHAGWMNGGNDVML